MLETEPDRLEVIGMDGAQFDQLTRAFRHRRGWLRVIAGGGLAGLGGLLWFADPTGAKNKGKKNKKKKKKPKDECGGCPSGTKCCVSGGVCCPPILPICCLFGCCPDEPFIRCGPDAFTPCIRLIDV